MNYIETLVGVDLMSEFMKSYINKFAYSTVNNTQFKDTLNDFIMKKMENSLDIINQIRYDVWLE